MHDEIDRQLRELMLEGHNERVREDLERLLDDMHERDCRISAMLDELLEEVERLLLLMDELDLDDE